MKLLKNIKKILANLSLSLKRFPLTISFSTATTIVLIILVNYHSTFNTNTINILKRIAMCLSLGFPIFLSFNLLFERFNNYKIIEKRCIQMGGGVFLILYYFFLLEELYMVTITRYVAINLFFYLTALIVHYFYKRDNYVLYIGHIFTRFLVSVIYSAVLYVGLAATLFTLNKLLGLPVSSELYLTVWLTVAGVFAPIFLLAGVPGYSHNFDLKGYSVFLKILLLYIVLPLITVYTIILYLYFLKIIITWQWPQGLVAHLVLWYSVISLIVIFFTSPFNKKNNWVKTFSTWFPKTILPLLVMMFFAIGIRISEYGVTENRYFVVLLGVWVFGIMMYYNLVREKRNIIIPLSLAIITVISVFGPWSAFSVSINSQNKRFEDILSRNNMIKEERIIKRESPIPKEDKKEIGAILSYFKNNHSLQELKYLPSDFTTRKMEETFGFQYQLKREIDFQHFSYELYNTRIPVEIRDYDYFLEITSTSTPGYHPKEEKIVLRQDKNIRVKYNDNSFVFDIYEKDNKLYSRSLQTNFLKMLRKIKNKKEAESAILPEDYTIVEENKDVRIKILVKNVTGGIGKTDEKNINFNRIKFNVFIKVKK